MIKNIIALVITMMMFSGCTSREQSLHPSHRILFFGDSITELGVQPGGYVSIIRDSLSSFGLPYEVIGAGISGNKVNDLLDRVEKDVLSKRPTIVVIYIGINDVWHYEFASRGLTGTPKDQFASGLKTLIGTIRSAGALVVLCTPTVIGEKKNGSNKYDAMLEEYSGVSRSVSFETGSSLCDLREAFKDSIEANNPADIEKNILTYDGVHLNDAGNRLVAAQILNVLDGLGLFFPQK